MKDARSIRCGRPRFELSQLLSRLKLEEKDRSIRSASSDEGEPFAAYLAGDSYEHYAEHAAQIREWRKTIS